MRTLDYLTGPSAPFFIPGLLAGLAIAAQGALLSVFVVLKRMAFIGQGVSHAAFGGVGLAVILGLAGPASFPLIALFCIAAAWGIALASSRPSRPGSPDNADTVIGVFLVGAMALGAILIALRARLAPAQRIFPAWDQVLFGSILNVTPADAWLASASLALTAFALLLARRLMLFWAFDEVAAASAGAPAWLARFILLTLLGLAVVTAMKLAGVVLATALLTIPGAAALRLSTRLAPVFLIAQAVALAALAAGLIASFELDLPPGACITAALILLYAAASAAAPALRRRHPATR